MTVESLHFSAREFQRLKMTDAPAGRIYQDVFGYETTHQMSKSHVCAVCGKHLLMLADPEQNYHYYLTCYENNYHQNDTNRTIHEGIVDKANFEKGEKNMAEKALAIKDIHSMAITEDNATKMIAHLYPKAPVAARTQAMWICSQYNLNPLLGHVFLIPFKKQGGGEDYVPVLSIKASRIIAARYRNYTYLDDTPRIMSQAEKEKIYGDQVEANLIYAICRLRDQYGMEFTGTGTWPKATSPYGTDKGNTKLNMAMIRAERAALNKLAPKALPEDIESYDSNVFEAPTGSYSISETATVNPETGEIVESEEATEKTATPPEKVETASTELLQAIRSAIKEKALDTEIISLYLNNICGVGSTKELSAAKAQAMLADIKADRLDVKVAEATSATSLL